MPLPSHPPPPTPAPLDRRHLGVALSLLAVTLVCGGIRMAPGVIGVYHDDGIYVATGKAIADGHGYVLDGLPDPLPQTKYPVLLPALFSLIWKVAPRFPENAVLFQSTCLLSMAMAIALAYLFLIRFRYAGPLAALLGAGSAALSPVVLYYATLPLSEGPFALLALISLWSLESCLHIPGRAGLRSAISGLAFGLCGLCRTVGFAWIGSSVFVLAKRRGARLAVPFLALSLPLLAGWLLWSRYGRSGEIPRILEYYVSYAVDWESVTAGTMPRIIGTNIAWVMSSLGSCIYPGAWILLLLVDVPHAFPIWILFFLFLGESLRLARQGRALPWMFAAYFLPIIIHPWPPERFWVPLAPVAGGIAAVGAGRLWTRWWPSRKRIALDLAAAAVALNLLYLAFIVIEVRRTHYPVVLPFDQTPRWETLRGGLDWLRANTPRDAVVAAALDPTVWLYSERHAYRFFTPRPLRVFYEGRKEGIYRENELLENVLSLRADYLLDTPLYNFAVDREIRRAIRRLADRNPSPLRQVYETPDHALRVYRVLTTPSSARQERRITEDRATARGGRR